MKIAFLQNFWHEYLGVMSVAAWLKRRKHEARVFINQAEKNLARAVLEFDPEVIAFPTYTGSEGWVLKTAWELKKKTGKLIVLGGPHATFFPEIIQERGVDIVCRGEGEYPMAELLTALAKGDSIEKIPNLWLKKGRKVIRNQIRPLIDPLDKLPLPEREVYYRYPILAKNPVKYFNVGRGCPFRCAYCHNAGLAKIYQGKGQYVRYRTSERVIEEIDRVREKYPLKTVCFADDTFVADKKWLFRFLPQYQKKIKLPFVCNLRADLLDQAVVESLARAGCISAFMGVESGDEGIRTRILEKRVTDKQLEKAAVLLHQEGIKIAANNMIGLPGESLAQAWETVRFNAKIKADFPWCSIFQPYPGTKLADYCLEKGYVTKKSLSQIGSSFLKRSVLKNQESQELINLQKLFHWGVKWPFLEGVIKVLIKLPLTRFYDLIFLANQGLTYKRFFCLDWLDFLPHAWHFGRFYLRSKKT